MASASLIEGLTAGVSGRLELQVAEEHCTRRGEYQIFSTPNMVKLLEFAAIDALRQVLKEGQISVGTRVDVRHLAPTLLGMTVRVEARVREVDGMRVVFDVEVFDGLDKVGEAVHERHVLELGRYAQRLEKKRSLWNDGAAGRQGT